MGNIPGGPVSKRPLHFIWIADCSGSMSLNGKIESLNQAIHQSIKPMKDVAKANPNAEVLMRCLKFSNGSAWHIKSPTPLQEFEWKDLKADPVEFVNIETEIVFLLDTSGSMNKEIEAVRMSCMDFSNKIIKNGSSVKLGLVGFAIGSISTPPKNATILRLSEYNLGFWKLMSPEKFKTNVNTLRLRSLGGKGCYLADQNTVEIFDHIVKLYSNTPNTKKILVIITDELGNTDGVGAISNILNKNNIRTYVLGLPGELNAHQALANKTNGVFWNIRDLRKKYDFSKLLNEVAEQIVREITTTRKDGSKGSGTDMGHALTEVSKILQIPPMDQNALPPVLVLISDGKPHDDFNAGLEALLNQNWGVKAVKLAISIGKDADKAFLKIFMKDLGIEPLEANNPDALISHIRWVSTTLLKSVSAPPSRIKDNDYTQGNVAIPKPPKINIDVKSVW